VSASPHTLIVVGLGIAGWSHIKALEQLQSITVLAGVDTDPDLSPKLTFRESYVPVHTELMDAGRRYDPDIVVVATPTSTHAAVCQEVGEHFPRATVLLEKPAADCLTAAQGLLKGKQDVYVALHMAFSPEVAWSVRLTEEMATSFGPPVAIQSFHTDAHRNDLDSAESRLSNSWVDSGINALSVIDQFATVTGRRSLRRLGETAWSMFAGTFTCGVEGGQAEALVVTSWNGADTGRSTHIRYASGAELIMDHNAVEAYALDNGELIGNFSDSSDAPRRERHYEALYKSWLVDSQPRSIADSFRLHELLLNPQGAEDVPLLSRLWVPRLVARVRGAAGRCVSGVPRRPALARLA
jgi:Oxidoreductase family, NAD-binding Rossmann fold